MPRILTRDIVALALPALAILAICAATGSGQSADSQHRCEPSDRSGLTLAEKRLLNTPIFTVVADPNHVLRGST